MKNPPVAVPRLRKKSPRKPKLVCSCGGSFQPRPPNGNLRYVGGETRVVSVDRDIGFSRLRSKIAHIWPHLPSFSIMYQLPLRNAAAATSLVSVASDADVARMIDVYDKLEAYGTLPCRLWVFVFREERDQLGGGFVPIPTNEFGRFEKGDRSDDFCPTYGTSFGIEGQFSSSVRDNSIVVTSRYSIDPPRNTELKQQVYKVNALYHGAPVCNQPSRDRIRNSHLPHPSTLRDVNLEVEANGSSHIPLEQSSYRLSRGNRTSFGGSIQAANPVNDLKQPFGSGAIFTGTEVQLASLVNQENLVPRSINHGSTTSNLDNNHSAMSVVPPKSSGSSIHCHRLRHQRACPYQRTSRTNGILSAAKSYPVLKPNGNISKHGQSMQVASPRFYNRQSDGNSKATSSSINALDPCIVYQSLHQNLTLNCESSCWDSGKKLIPINQQGKIKLARGARGAGLSSNKNETVSPVDLSFCHLSLSSSRPCLTDVSNAQMKPETKSIDLMELSTARKFDELLGVKSDSHSSDTPETARESRVVDAKSVIRGSCKYSNAFCGIPADLAAFYTHLVARELQTIKASDLEYLKELGSGTYGTVYYGKWKGSDVAIKKLKASCFTNAPADEDRL
ncbi:hypothetical protein CRG98_003861, partial [Punica granatum]